MSERMLGSLFQMNQETWQAVSRDPAIPQSVKTMIYLHLQKPWVPNFLAVIIAPMNQGLDAYLGRPVLERSGLTFYYPSLEWWFAHARTSHPPEGEGCDAQAHQDFLTQTGASAEFVYANVLKSGDIEILERPDFDAECAFWTAGNQ